MHIKTLGIDYGEKRIGLSVSDDLFLTAQPLGTIEYKSMVEAIHRIKETVDKKQIKKIVIGMPLTLSGVSGKKANEVTKFAKDIKDNLPEIEVITWDERLTTVEAERIMIDAGVRRRKRKNKIDTVAATLMLQSYIDFINQSSSLKHEIKN